MQAVSRDLYVILDQFEEYFLYHARDASSPTSSPTAIREPGLRANFLLGMREDALAKLDAFKGRLPNLLWNRLRLDRLNRAGRAAISARGSLQHAVGRGPVAIEPELVEEILDQVTAGRVESAGGSGGRRVVEERIEAPSCNSCWRLWEVERERDSSLLRLADVAELGGAERSSESISSGPRQAAPEEKAWPRRCTTSSSRRQGPRSRTGPPISPVRGSTSPKSRGSCTSPPRAHRPCSRETGGAERYEIFHDVLADGVLAWRARRILERDRE